MSFFDLKIISWMCESPVSMKKEVAHKFRKRKKAVKLHTLLDLSGNIPSVIIITTGKVHDVNILDDLIIEIGSIYVMDRGYPDFARLYKIHQASAFFVTRAKINFVRKRPFYRHLQIQPTQTKRTVPTTA